MWGTISHRLLKVAPTKEKKKGRKNCHAYKTRKLMEIEEAKVRLWIVIEFKAYKYQNKQIMKGVDSCK